MLQMFIEKLHTRTWLYNKNQLIALLIPTLLHMKPQPAHRTYWSWIICKRLHQGKWMYNTELEQWFPEFKHISIFMAWSIGLYYKHIWQNWTPYCHHGRANT